MKLVGDNILASSKDRQNISENEPKVLKVFTKNLSLKIFHSELKYMITVI